MTHVVGGDDLVFTCMTETPLNMT